MLHMQVEVTRITSEKLLFSEDTFYERRQVLSFLLAKNQTSKFLNEIWHSELDLSITTDLWHLINTFLDAFFFFLLKLLGDWMLSVEQFF